MLQPLNQPVSGIADANGDILFKFESIPNSQYWTGVLSCPLSPTTAQHTATNLGVDYFGLWVANNPFGPVYVPSGQIWVSSTGLDPGETYVMYFTGYVSTEVVTAPVWPMPIANTVLATVTNVNSVTFTDSEGFAIIGAVSVPSGYSNSIPPDLFFVPANQTITIIGVIAATLSGTVTFNVQQNGVNVPGLTALVATSTPQVFYATNQTNVANLDEWSIVPTSVSSPEGFTVKFIKVIAT
jgi:hypothetical protein